MVLVRASNVPLVISGAGFAGAHRLDNRVETTSVAPTILTLLGLDPARLRAVAIEKTPTLDLTR